MLTRLIVRRFKRFPDLDIELGNNVVFVGPNNSGKSTALQALTLWDVGLRRWQEKRGGKETPAKRPGVTLNRRDLIAVPVPNAKLLWQDLHVRDVRIVNEKQTTKNVTIDITVHGVTQNKLWECGLEFDYANEESFYCRPLRLGEDKRSDRMPVPEGAVGQKIAYLPPMSGLASTENRLDPGAISVHVGEGRTAEVLRNLCYRIYEDRDNSVDCWVKLTERIENLFGVKLMPPNYVEARGEITMEYRERSGAQLDFSCSGRGLQQTVLLLAYLYANPSTVLLLDEPDAHLEILRQRQIYDILTTAARENGSQIVAASHSEVLLKEAVERDVVIAFVGRPHRIDDRGSQVLKALREIESDQYYLAEQTGFVLYLEGSTDLAILHAFAATIGHAAREALDRPFVKYFQNQPKKAEDHFFGLQEGKDDLVGFALFDADAPQVQDKGHLRQHKWRRREIESYLCQRETLMGYAEAFAREQAAGPLFDESEVARIRRAMEETIDEIEDALEKLDKSPYSPDTKVSDEFLAPVFKKFFSALELPNLMNKSDYHELARFVSKDDIDEEVETVLDGILEVFQKACPATEP